MVKQAWNFTDEQMLTKPPEVRSLLQIVGTDLIRNQIDPDFWVKKLYEENKDLLENWLHDKNVHICLTDARFLNELEWVRTLGGIVIRIIRAGIEQSSHISEIESASFKADFTIENNGTIEEYRDKIRFILKDILNG